MSRVLDVKSVIFFIFSAFMSVKVKVKSAVLHKRAWGAHLHLAGLEPIDGEDMH